MGLFDGLSGMIENAISSHAGGLSGLMSEALTNFGGLDGIVAKLNDAGLGTKVNSWLGKGDNVPLSADEISSVLGSAQLQEIAGEQINDRSISRLPVQRGIVGSRARRIDDDECEPLALDFVQMLRLLDIEARCRRGKGSGQAKQ